MSYTHRAIPAVVAGLLLSLLLVPQAHAQSRWLNIAEPGYQAIMMDTTTVIDSGSQLRVWIRREFDRAQKVNAVGTATAFSYRSLISRFDIDCAQGKYKKLQSNYYRADGSVARSFPEDTFAQEWESPVPESVGEDTVKGACKWFRARG